MSRSFSELGGKLEALRYDIGPGGDLERRTLAAFALAPEVAQAVTADIGDTSMSGWTRHKPIKMGGKVTKLDGEQFAIDPIKGTAGPLRVMERGRNLGETGAFQGPGAVRGTGLTQRNKNGSLRKVKAWKSKKWNGYTSPQKTWSEAAEAIAAKAPAVLNEQKQAALRKHFGF